MGLKLFKPFKKLGKWVKKNKHGVGGLIKGAVGVATGNPLLIASGVGSIVKGQPVEFSNPTQGAAPSDQLVRPASPGSHGQSSSTPSKKSKFSQFMKKASTNFNATNGNPSLQSRGFLDDILDDAKDWIHDKTKPDSTKFLEKWWPIGLVVAGVAILGVFIYKALDRGF